MGIPWSGPRSCPWLSSRSSCRAYVSARSAVNVMKEFRWRLASSAFKASVTNSSLDTLRARSAAAASRMVFMQELSIRRATVKAMSTHERYPCAMEEQPGRRQVRVKRVDECDTLHDVFTHCLPAFGGAFLRRIYTILDRAIGMGCPLDPFDRRAGHRLRPASGMADPADGNGLDRLPQHHRRGLLSRRPPQPGRAQARADPRSPDLYATTPRCATIGPSG